MVVEPRNSFTCCKLDSPPALTEGHRLTYDLNGNRRSDTRNSMRIVEQGGAGSGQCAAEAGESTEVYGYDALNRLTTTVRDGALVDSRGHDAANRVINSAPGAVGVDYINLHRQWRGTDGHDALQGRQNLYDASGNALYAYYAYEGTPQTQVNGQRQLVVNGEVLGRYGLMANNRFEARRWRRTGRSSAPRATSASATSPSAATTQRAARAPMR
jgi:hypothetical protein